MPKRASYIFTVPAFILAVLCWGSCNKIKPAKHTVSPIPVEVTIISESGDAAVQNYVGTIHAASSSALSFAVPGNITAVHVKEGQRVSEGQLLAEIDDKSYQDSYAAAQATLRQAQDGFERLKQLHEKGSITEVQWVEIQTKLAQAQSSEALAKRNLDNCRLYAPFSGVVGQIEVGTGMNVMPSITVFTLLKINHVEVRVPIPENIISTLHSGQAARVTIPALGDRILESRIADKGVVANPLSHNYDVSIPLDNPTGDLMPGMVCNVRISQSDSTQRIVLDNHTVKSADVNRKFVWVVHNGKAEQRTVTTGGLAPYGIIITSGLSEGDSVITKGDQKVSSGMAVQVLP
ncbi:MAG: efflux RND transporter periplasmic adaptor subunit [Bacteroidales bacterium]|nr:efflux RND transporter periplasmic adaptor subunit [Bacteroidales bacterium]